MPYVGSSGRKLYLDGPKNDSQARKLAYAVIVAAILLSVVALFRLGAAASASVAASVSVPAVSAGSAPTIYNETVT